MTPALRRVSLAEDREELILFLERHFPAFHMRTHFSWRHEGNPAGPGWSWVIYDRNTGAIGAMTSLFPRPMLVNGKRVICGQVGEFAVDATYRSLGPAVMLQRATFGPVDDGELAFCYDCPPHDQGMSTFVRLGMRSNCELIRYALPLRSDQVVEKRFGNGAWTKPIIAGANLLLKLKKQTRHEAGIEIRKLNGQFDEEFSHLDQAVSSMGTVRSSRTAEFLNWRYRRRTDLDIEVFVAFRGGEVLAFLACIIYPERRACVCDLFGRDLEDAGLALLDATVNLCRQRKVFCLESYCSEINQTKLLFESAGFRARERAARVVAYGKTGEISGILNSGTAWTIGSAELNA